MKYVIRTRLLLLLVGLLIACQPIHFPAPPPRQAATRTLPQTSMPDVVQAIRMQLAMQLRNVQDNAIAPVDIIQVEPVNWQDSCLGVAVKSLPCVQVLTPGYKVTVAQNSRQYVYHTDTNGMFHLVKAPVVTIAKPLVIFTQTDGAAQTGEQPQCRRSVIGDGLMAFGYCSEPQISAPFANVDYNDQLEGLRAQFASFTSTMPLGEIVFNGTGKAIATPSEQRMVAEWARLTTQAAFAGRSGASWDFGLGYRQNPGSCWQLIVSITGLVTQNDCGGGYSYLRQTQRLTAQQAEQFYGWLDALYAVDDPRAMLSGHGKRMATAQEIKGIYLFSEKVLDSLPDDAMRSTDTTTSISPNGQWVAESNTLFPKQGSYQENYRTQLIVRRRDYSLSWTPVDSQQPWGLGYTMPKPLVWSKDNNALYYTNMPVPDGCAIFVNGSDLHRVDLTTGRVMTVAPQLGLWLALSADETHLAGISGAQLTVYDLTTKFGEVIPLPADEWIQFGHAVWSPDGKKIALTGARKPCSDETRYDTLIVDVKTKTVTTLIKNDDHLFVPTGWEDTWHVILRNKDHIWLLNVQTGKLQRMS